MALQNVPTCVRCCYVCAYSSRLGVATKQQTWEIFVVGMSDRQPMLLVSVAVFKCMN